MAPQIPTTTPSAPPVPRQRTGLFCPCLCGAMLLMIGGLLFSLVYHLVHEISGSHPDFQVLSVATTTPFNLTTTNNTNTATLANINAAFNITFWVGQPNIGFIYSPAKVSVYYHNGDKASDNIGDDFYLSSSTLESLCPGRKCNDDDLTSKLPVTVIASLVPVQDDYTVFVMTRDLEKGEFGITIKIMADYRVGVSSESKLRVTCKDVKIRVPSGIMVGDPRRCKVDWDVDKWYLAL